MQQPIATGVFKPKASQAETKSDATTRAARAIIDSEAAQRIAKTERLRAARRAKEDSEGPRPLLAKKTARKR